MNRSFALTGALMTFAGAGLTPANAGEPTTTFQSASGSWAVADNWSSGVPTAAHRAEIPPQSAAIVAAAGATCANLHVGTGAKGFGAQVIVTTGSLAVGEVLRIGTPASFTSGIVSLSHGTVTAPLLLVERGGFTAAGGAATFGACIIDGGALTVLGGTLTVTGDVTVEDGFALTIGGGTFLAGTTTDDEVLVRTEIALVNPNVLVTLQNLTLEGAGSRLRATIGALGLDAINVEGTFTRGGRLIVHDLDAPEGRHDLVVAGTIAGEFVTIELPPTGDWSWGVENSTLFVFKGEKIPVEATSWGGIKQSFALDDMNKEHSR